MAYLPLSTANLPDPVIDPAQGASPEDHFNTAIWTGDNTSGRSIPTGHQPDFVWTKERNSAINHISQNSISGTGLYLHPNTTAAEQPATTLITSFDSDGFTIGNSGSINGTDDTYVAWSWKAGGSTGVTNTAGTTTGAVTVSANQTAGFSIVKYVGQHSTGGACTIGHGLNAVPSFIIAKQTSGGANDWPVYHASEGAGKFAKFNETPAFVSETTVWNNTPPTTSVFSVGSGNLANNNGQNYIAYVFAEVDGFSKFGSFIGDGSTTVDGPFVYLGFRPAFVILKPAEESRDWRMYDSKRNSYNRAEDPLQANTPAIESNESGTGGVDFLSNGFKVRTSNPVIYNSSTKKIIYMAFAENPFKYSNAR